MKKKKRRDRIKNRFLKIEKESDNVKFEVV